MKKFFLPIFAVLLVLGSILPLAAYRVTRAVLSGAEPASSAASSAVSSPAASASTAAFAYAYPFSLRPFPQ